MATAPLDPQGAEALVLILLHGAGANRAMWNAVRRHLDPRWQVVALDLPGHGSLSGSHYTLEAAVSTVAEEVRRLAPARVVLVGDSLGGYTSIASAQVLAPERVAGLALGGCSMNFDRKIRGQLRRKGWMVRALMALLGEKRLIAKSADKMVKQGIRREDADALVAGGLRMQGWIEAANSVSSVDFLARLPAIQAPILFINGDKDSGPVAHEAEFVAAARDASVRRFPCEHGVSLWEPAGFAEAVNRFVEGLATPQEAAAA